MVVRGVVLFPGAGSSRDHAALIAIENQLSPLPVLRVDFPYRKAGKKFPDKAPILVQCVKDEVRAFAQHIGCETTDLVIGGRSMGGRMCTMAGSDVEDVLRVAGVVCIGYPLHPPKKPEQLRIEHLPRLISKALFISGTRDEFGTPVELASAFASLPSPPAVQFIEGGRHELKGHDEYVATLFEDWLRTV
jgi:predicted alpha/beta-hydrolase family hydrolase